MINFRRVLSSCLVVALIGTLSITSYASDKPKKLEKVCITTTKAERDAEFEKAMEEIMGEMEKENLLARGPKYRYKTVYKSYKYKTLSGYAGKQVPGGYKFSTGGGFWFTDSGGPTVTGSVSVGLPKPYNMISVSVNLGKKGSSGLWVRVSSSKYHYKLHISKKMELRPYITYRTPVGKEKWEVYKGGAVQLVYSITAKAKRA